jgi:purine-nucleoside phosphorylase
LATATLVNLLARAVPHALKAYTWTTDAIFRETKQEVLFYAKQGAATVEMEAAALFAVAFKRGLRAAGVFVISDLLSPAAWQHEPNPENYNKIMEGNLKRLVETFR